MAGFPDHIGSIGKGCLLESYRLGRREAQRVALWAGIAFSSPSDVRMTRLADRPLFSDDGRGRGDLGPAGAGEHLVMQAVEGKLQAV